MRQAQLAWLACRLISTVSLTRSFFPAMLFSKPHRRFPMNTRKSLAALLLVLSLTLFAMPALAADVKGSLNDATTIKDVLSQHVGKRVAVRTDGGETLDGTVAKVTGQLVYIEKLVGKEYFDAVVRIDRISSVTFRMRTN